MAKRTLGTHLSADLGLESTNRDAAAEQFERVKAALEVHGVVVLPQQRDVTREQLHAFALRFGPIALHIGQGANEHPALPGMLTINDGFAEDEVPPEPGATQFGPTWHTDFAACVRPGYATVLHCRDTPTGAHPYERCDTMFADLVAAYDALEPEEQMELQRLKVRVSYRSSARYRDVFSGLYHGSNSESVRDNEPSLMKNMKHFNEVEAREMMHSLRPDVEHPLVRSVLGRPVLFIGQADTAFIVDSKEPDADEVEFDVMVKGAERLRELQAYATQPQFQHKHIWTKYDVSARICPGSLVLNRFPFKQYWEFPQS